MAAFSTTPARCRASQRIEAWSTARVPMRQFEPRAYERPGANQAQRGEAHRHAAPARRHDPALPFLDLEPPFASHDPFKHLLELFRAQHRPVRRRRRRFRREDRLERQRERVRHVARGEALARFGVGAVEPERARVRSGSVWDAWEAGYVWCGSRDALGPQTGRGQRAPPLTVQPAAHR